MKININRKLDTNYLINSIINSKEKINYIIMNEDTLKDIKKDFSSIMPYTTTDEYYYSTIHGISIAICNKLKYGEVDLI